MSETLYLVHGWAYDGRVWDELRAALASHGYPSQSINLPGYGDSPAKPVADIAALAEHLLAHTPAGSTLIAWSLGAMAALAAAAKAPQHFRQLVLIGTTASFVSRDGWPAALPAEQLAGFRAALDSDAGKLLNRFATLCNQGQQDGDGQANLARVLSRRLASQNDRPPSIDALADGLRLLADSDLRPLLAQVHTPCLLLHGEHDPLMPLAAARQLLQLLPSARLEVVAGAAHAPFLADPAATAALLAAWLQRGNPHH